MKKWFMKHWIISSFLVLFIIGSIMSGFEEGNNQVLENTIPVSSEVLLNVPEYSIIAKTDLINGNVLLEVLILSLSQEDSEDKIKDIASQIGEKYESNQIQIYCSLDAQKANYSASFAEKNPNAIDECYLGEFNL